MSEANVGFVLLSIYGQPLLLSFVCPHPPRFYRGTNVLIVDGHRAREVPHAYRA